MVDPIHTILIAGHIVRFAGRGPLAAGYRARVRPEKIGLTRVYNSPSMALHVKPIEVTSLDFNLTEHCNLRCAGCDHGSPHFPSQFASLEEFERDLKAVAQVLRTGQLMLVGGEPLMHPQLIEFLLISRRSGIATRIGVVTNGLLLHSAPPELWTSLDLLWVSIYPGIRYPFDRQSLERQAAEHGVNLWFKETPTFRQTLLNERNEDVGLVHDIYQRCRIAHLSACHTLHEGRYYKCSPAPFIATRLAIQGKAYQPSVDPSMDGISVRSNPRLREELVEYLTRSGPLAACEYCLGSSGHHKEHSQLNKIGLRAERDEKHDNVRALIDWEAFHEPWRSTRELPEWMQHYEKRRLELISQAVAPPNDSNQEPKSSVDEKKA